MGAFVDGKWREGDFPHDTTGHFVRPDAPFRNWVTASGEPGPERRRRLQGGDRPLSSHHLARLPVGASHPHLPSAERSREHDLALGRPLAAWRARLDLRSRPRSHSRSDLRRERAPRVLCQGAPRLQRPRHGAGALGQDNEHDRQQRIVGNHPHVQQRLRWGRRGGGRLLSERAQPEIDEINDRIYRTVNNGVYRAGFATSQEAYEEAFRALFETLDWLEARLAGQRFLIGQRLTEADWRLFTTLIRFDAVYFGHFKCNLGRSGTIRR